MEFRAALARRDRCLPSRQIRKGRSLQRGAAGSGRRATAASV